MTRTSKILAALTAAGVFVCGIFAPRAEALEVPLGVITATTTAQTNSTTAVPFTIPQSSRLAIQCDASGYVYFSADGSAATSSNGVKVNQDDFYDTSSGFTRTTISVIAVSGTINCRVFQVY